MLTLLTDAELYAPEAQGRCDLLLGGGRVIGIAPSGRGAALASGEAVQLEDLGGVQVIPGLVDIHAHITGGGGEDGASTKVPAPLLASYVEAGVTSVVGLLGTDDITRSTAELLAGVRGLRELGLSAWCWTGGYHLPPTTLTGTIRGDIVHLDAVIGAGEIAISDHRSSQPTLEDLLRVASECHVGGLVARKAGVLHLHLGDGSRGLELVRAALEQSEIPARVFQPTHVNRRTALFAEGLELAARGCHLDFTAFPVEEGEDAYTAGEALGRALDAGVPVERLSVSSDGGGCLPTFDEEGRMVAMDVGTSIALPETLATLVAEGRTLEAVLPAFTSSPADYLRLEGKGRLAAGSAADLVVLAADGTVARTMAGGRWMN
jgi:beta-aspartyl-dipeptidase (metallo-type)